MKIVAILLCNIFILHVFATDDPKDAKVTNYEFVRGTSNNYRFEFDSSDGTSRQEQGSNDSSNSLAINGTVSWVAQDGSRYQMSFKADKRGFRPIIKRISGP